MRRNQIEDLLVCIVERLAGCPKLADGFMYTPGYHRGEVASACPQNCQYAGKPRPSQRIMQCRKPFKVSQLASNYAG